MKTLTQFSGSLMLSVALAAGLFPAAGRAADEPSWVATWSASPQPVWGTDFLFPLNAPSELHHQTVRQIARVSLGGERIRILLSNAYGRQPVTLGKATLALPATDVALVADSLRTLTFGGRETATILPGASLISDPVALSVPALGQVALSLYLPEKTPVSTFHWDGRQSGWIVPGDRASDRQWSDAEGAAQITTTRLLWSGVEVETPAPARAVAVIGDSITDGAAASLDKDRRWPDLLAARLAPHGAAVINAGISGGRLLSDGMGVNGLARLERDVLDQSGVQSVIVMLGINDIAWPGTAFAPTSPRPTLAALTAGYRQLIAQAHRRGVRVIGATLTPFAGALPDTPLDDYYHPEKDALRRQVNDWIRDSGAFDVVIDFDAALRDAAHPERLDRDVDSGDRLHPGDAGNRVMADAVDLNALFADPTILDGNHSAATQEQ
ncbi:SGNH/GDSL hydrolase family protein [Brenneria tiliae]|uniref:SGNH/GDSL hydrolase family protein n=1 Tax=Brenneria tiliae TaxID=2914984 RepID=UPI002014995F|nr:SGNH/GDSL hydrolase family protein [Brenneria tiliae]MCL2899648.1 SGNH/GDSL hydrolase family protein [Brenneria tiliae]MCL2904026.1 SGNH/GDSL hydrolase family protein [Brenneria tiliae]